MAIAKAGMFFITMSMTPQVQQTMTLQKLRKIVKDGMLRSFMRYAEKHGWQYKLLGCIADVHCSDFNFVNEVDFLTSISDKGRFNVESLSHGDMHVHILLYCSAGESGRKKLVSYWEKKKLGYSKFHGSKVSRDCQIWFSNVLYDFYKDIADCTNRVNYIHKNYKYSLRNHRYRFKRGNELREWETLYYELKEQEQYSNNNQSCNND